MNYTGITNCIKPVISLRKINEIIVNTKKTSKFMLPKVRTKRTFFLLPTRRRRRTSQTIFSLQVLLGIQRDTTSLLDNIAMLTFLIAVGLIAGTLGSMLGVGGGIIMVPALTLLNLPPTQAASTSLIAVMSTSISSTIEYSRQKRIDYGLGLEMAACAIPGGVLGAILSEYLLEDTFKLYFGILLILTGVYIVYKNSVLKDLRAKRRSFPLQVAVFAASFGAGVISSLFGVGGGIIFVPAMLLVLGLTMHRAAPTSQLILMMTAIAGVFTHSVLGHPDYLQAVVLSAGAFAGAQIGARLSRMAKDVLLQRLLAIILMAVAVTFILDGLSVVNE